MDHDGFACTLDRASVERRAALLHDLAGLVREVHHEPHTAVLRFPSTSLHAVQRFVTLESRCCSFLTFTHDRVGDDLSLTVTVPDGAEPLLSELVQAIDRGAHFWSRAAAIDRLRRT